PYLVTSTRSPFFISKGTFLPLSSVLPVPRATIRLSMGFSLAVSGIKIPPFLSSFSSTASTRIRSPMGLTFSVIVCHFFHFFCFLIQLSTDWSNLLNIRTGHSFVFRKSCFGAESSGLVLCLNSSWQWGHASAYRKLPSLKPH